MKRVKKAIKNARPTNPLAAQASKDGDPKKDKRKPGSRGHHDRSGHHEHRSRRHADDRPPI